MQTAVLQGVIQQIVVKGNPAVERRASSVIQIALIFTELSSVIGPENSRLSLNQSGAKLKAIATWLFSFPARQAALLFYFEFSWANDNLNLCSDWSLGFPWFWLFRHLIENCSRTKFSQLTFLRAVIKVKTQFSLLNGSANQLGSVKRAVPT